MNLKTEIQLNTEGRLDRIAYDIALATFQIKSADLAQGLGWHESKLSRIVVGRKIASQSEKAAIANALGLKVSELFPETEE